MGADNYSCNLSGRVADEYDARIREEHARFKAALITIRDNRQTALGARIIATHALQDGHTVAAPNGGASDGT